MDPIVKQSVSGFELQTKLRALVSVSLYVGMFVAVLGVYLVSLYNYARLKRKGHMMLKFLAGA